MLVTKKSCQSQISYFFVNEVCRKMYFTTEKKKRNGNKNNENINHNLQICNFVFNNKKISLQAIRVGYRKLSTVNTLYAKYVLCNVSFSNERQIEEMFFA